MILKDAIERFLIARGWDWEIMREAWRKQTGGVGIIDTIRVTGDIPQRGKWSKELARCFNVPSCFIHIMSDDDPCVAGLQELVVNYAAIVENKYDPPRQG